MIEALDKGAEIPSPEQDLGPLHSRQEAGILQAFRSIAGSENTTYSKGTGGSFLLRMPLPIRSTSVLRSRPHWQQFSATCSTPR